MDRLGEMLVFVRAVEDGSFSAAGRSLSLSPSAVSKMIARLENRLGVALFNRSLRSLTMTPEGEAFYPAARQAIGAVEEAEAAAFGGVALRDVLRVRSMPTFAIHELAPLVPAFRRQHPGLRLEFILGNEAGNLLEGGVDVAIYIGELPDSSLIARRITVMRWIICAAPAYLAERGLPSTPAELAEHECLNFNKRMPWSTWTFRDSEHSVHRIRASGSVTANQGQMLMALALAGVGIARLAEFQIAGDLAAGRLVRLFPEHESGMEESIYAVHQSKRHVSQRVRVFLDFLEARFSRPAA
ncbi:LysR family transcriptional regulator [Roseomonas sp. M0104]|uniref:LysR family transcriptional regulator n=1 Tax=Teichococcus coralli TaxID=2545983 RepID=A0A845BJE0_9PROT|nr:LysR family transcriptional regulator [Pseudoroseomonas coralli]MXP65292.1 LysR family transcriptional regulator [Pseudoroseomonas coralli]